MRLPGTRRLAFAWRRFFPHGAILLYHRVHTLETDPQLLAVSPTRFAEHLQMLNARFHVVPLAEFVRRLQAGRLHRGTVAITFDDGYADNLSEAAPLLHQLGLPATVFITASAIDATEEFYWDEIERIFLLPSERPPYGTLDIGGQRIVWDMGDDQVLSDEAFRLRRAWNVAASHPPTPRQAAYIAVCRFVRELPPEGRREALARLRAWANLAPRGRATHRTLTTPELKTLAAQDGIAIGAHALSHPWLPALSPARQREEIVGGRRALENVIGADVSFFSYPYGGRDDYGPESVAITRACGFKAACAAFEGTVPASADPFELPRFSIRDVTAERLEELLNGWLG